MKKILALILPLTMWGGTQDNDALREKITGLQKKYEDAWNRMTQKAGRLSKYWTEWREAVGNKIEKEATRDELFEAISKSRVVFLGDYHGDEPLIKLQRDFVKTLQEVLKKPVALGHEHATSKEVIEEARKLNWKIVDLEPAKRGFKAPKEEVYYKRDEEIAETIDTFCKDNPDHILVAIYGDGHLLGAKHAGELVTLPKTIVLTNSDWLYFSIALEKNTADLEGKIYQVRKDVYYYFTGDANKRDGSPVQLKRKKK